MFEVKRRKVLAGLGATALTAPFVSRMALAQGGDPINIGVVTALSGAQEFIGSFVVNGCACWNRVTESPP